MKRIRTKNPNTKKYWDTTAIKNGFLTNIKVDKAELGALIKKEMVGTSIDIGAGSGMLTKYLDVDVACDYSKPAVKQLAKYAKLVFTCDLTKGLCLEDGSFDTVISTETLEHFDEPHKIAKELARIAKKKVIITTPNGDYGLESKEHVWLFDEKDLHDMFKQYGETETVIYNKTIILICTS